MAAQTTQGLTSSNELRAIASSSGARPEPTLTRMVEVLDHAIHDESVRDEDHGVASQMLACLVVAVGGLLFNEHPGHDGIAATRDAARAYLIKPNDDTWAAYANLATNSYPYGPGDGCYKFGNPMDNCFLGDGCFSGSGNLHSAGVWIGFEPVRVAPVATLNDYRRR